MISDLGFRTRVDPEPFVFHHLCVMDSFDTRLHAISANLLVRQGSQFPTYFLSISERMRDSRPVTVKCSFPFGHRGRFKDVSNLCV